MALATVADVRKHISADGKTLSLTYLRLLVHFRLQLLEWTSPLTRPFRVERSSIKQDPRASHAGRHSRSCDGAQGPEQARDAQVRALLSSVRARVRPSV